MKHSSKPSGRIRILCPKQPSKCMPSKKQNKTKTWCRQEVGYQRSHTNMLRAALSFLFLPADISLLCVTIEKRRTPSFGSYISSGDFAQ